MYKYDIFSIQSYPFLYLWIFHPLISDADGANKRKNVYRLPRFLVER